MGVVKRTNKEWAELIRQQQTSGLTMKSWCMQNGINLYTMADRVTRMRKEGIIKEPKPNRGGKPKKQGWIEITASRETENDCEPKAKGIQVSMGKFTITIPDNFNETVFAKICKELMKLC